MKNNIKILIIIIIICFLCAILVLKLDDKHNFENLKFLNDYNDFFSVSNCINNYIMSITNNNIEKTYHLLSEDYISENNINKENLYSIIETYDKNVYPSIVYIKYVNINQNIIYYIETDLYKNEMDLREKIDKSFKTLVIEDTTTNSYSIYPIDNNLKHVIDKIKRVRIENNKYNSIVKDKKINNERICSSYLSNYVSYLYIDIDKAYGLLSDNMKNVKFNSIEKFHQYINDNLNKFTPSIDECKIEKLKKETIYTVIDKNGNKYIFNEKSIFNYNVDIYVNENLSNDFNYDEIIDY